MALPPLFRRVAEAIGVVDPLRQASPEDDAAPAELGGMVSKSGDRLFIGAAFMKALAVNDDTILRREGSQDLKLFDALLDDDVAMSNFQQRRLAVVSRDWEVAPGDDKDPRSVEAADHLRAQLKQVGWDHVSNLMLFAVWYGYGVAEAIYKLGPDGLVWIDEIVVPDRRWFGFTNEGELRMTAGLIGLDGEEVPPNKFWSIRTGGTHDFAFYGLGLAHWCYWPIWFKRTALRFWAVYLEKLGVPTAVGEYDQDGPAPEKAKRTMLDALVGIGRDSAVVFPKGQSESVKFLEATRTGGNGSGFKDFVTEQNEALMRIVLGQPGTSKATPQGVGGKQSEVHADVKAEIVKADSDMLSESFARTIGAWVTRWNFGPDVAPPTVYRVLDDAEDLTEIAERDATLDAIGIKRTEKSIGEVYGDGYEKVEPPAPPPAIPGQLPGQPGGNVVDLAAERAKRKVEFAAMDATPLYVSRRLTNVGPLRKWAAEQGIELQADLHVTVLYSRKAVDWFELGGWDWGDEASLTVGEGGPRTIEAFGDGDDKVLVLRFASARLKYRHDDMVERGASHDHGDYAPHVTLAPLGDRDPATIKPFTGELRFGPEIFEAIEEEPDPSAMIEFAAAELDAIDRLTAALVDETNPVIVEFAAGLRESLAGVTSLEGARVALLQAFEQFPVERLARATGLPLLAERAAGEAGIDERVTA